VRFAEKLSFCIAPTALKNIAITETKEYTRLQKYAKNTVGNKVALKSLHFEAPEVLIQQLPQHLVLAERPNVFLLEAPATEQSASVVPPHIDYRRSCGVNVYLEAGGEVTQFYEWDSATGETTVVEEFEAKRGECWLLNTSVPHGVLLVKGKSRKILTFSFSSLTYDQVKNYANY